MPYPDVFPHTISAIQASQDSGVGAGVASGVAGTPSAHSGGGCSNSAIAAKAMGRPRGIALGRPGALQSGIFGAERIIL